MTEKGPIDYVCNVIKEKNLYRREFKALKKRSNDRFHIDNDIKSLVKKNRNEATFLVQKDPGRSGMIEAFDEKRTEQLLSVTKESNDHMIVQFSIMLLEMALKHHVIHGLSEGVAVQALGDLLQN